jgi:hypothetical protein
MVSGKWCQFIFPPLISPKNELTPFSSRMGILRKEKANEGTTFGACIFPHGKNFQFFTIDGKGFNQIDWFNWEPADTDKQANIEDKLGRLLKDHPSGKEGDDPDARIGFQDYFTTVVGAAQLKAEKDKAGNLPLVRYVWNRGEKKLTVWRLKPVAKPKVGGPVAEWVKVDPQEVQKIVEKDGKWVVQN